MGLRWIAAASGAGWAAHLAGEPVAEAAHLELLRPWLAAAADALGAQGHRQDGPFAAADGWGDESRAGRLVSHVCSAYLPETSG